MDLDDIALAIESLKKQNVCYGCKKKKPQWFRLSKYLELVGFCEDCVDNKEY